MLMRDELFIVISSYVDDDLRIDPCWETSPGEGMNSKMRRGCESQPGMVQKLVETGVRCQAILGEQWSRKG
jgi:hypothetical protein